MKRKPMTKEGVEKLINHPIELPPMNTDITHFNSHTLYCNLLKLSSNRKVVDKYSRDFNKSKIENEIKNAAEYVVKCFENYLASKDNKASPHPIKNIKTEMNTFKIASWYFISKLYGSLKVKKTVQGFKGKKNEELQIGFEESSYEEYVKKTAMFLKEQDASMNKDFEKTNDGEGNSKDLMFLEKLFLSLHNPLFGGDLVKVQKELNVSDLSFYNNLNVLNFLLHSNGLGRTENNFQLNKISFLEKNKLGKSESFVLNDIIPELSKSNKLLKYMVGYRKLIKIGTDYSLVLFLGSPTENDFKINSIFNNSGRVTVNPGKNTYSIGNIFKDCYPFKILSDQYIISMIDNQFIYDDLIIDVKLGLMISNDYIEKRDILAIEKIIKKIKEINL